MKDKSLTTGILWAVFISLLVVLLPHTAWAFKNFEPAGADTLVLFAIDSMTVTTSDVISYVAAFAFEAAIAVLVHKLAEHLGKKLPKSIDKSKKWNVFSYRYLNPISFALIVTTAVSALANLAHAVQFGRTLRIFDEWGVPFAVYTVAFGGILPLVSMTFARVLSNIVEDEDAPNPELTQANETIRSLRQLVRETEAKVKAAEQQANETERRAEQRVNEAEAKAKTAEDRFGAMGDLVKYLFGEDKKQRIIFARRQWARLPNSAIAVIADASPAYVSEVLSDAIPVDFTTTTSEVGAESVNSVK